MIKTLTCEGFRGFSSRESIELAMPNGKRGSGLTTLIGPNGGGKSTIVECFSKFASSSVSFTEGKRNRQADDRVHLSLTDHDNNLFEIKTVSTGGSETIITGSSLKPLIYYLPARRVFNSYFGKGTWSRKQYLTNPEQTQFRANVSNNITNRLFTALEHSEKFNRVFWRILATMGEVLEYEAEKNSKGFSYEREADINEVLNYRKAMWHAIEMLKDLPLCQRVIKEAHQVLLSGVRGHGKAPGEYRKTSNWIGPPGCTIEDAKFVPISADKLADAMSMWERYIHDDYPDRLVQLAIIHAEFEALHPFLDGNGRLGRMCVPLFMYKIGLIHSPMFYISAFFEKNRDEYYDKLLAVSRGDDWTGWCEFFLKAVETQANKNQTKATEILNLYESKKKQIVDLTRSQYAIYTLDFIFSRPIFNSKDFSGMGEEIPATTSKRILNILLENEVLKIVRESSGRKPSIYAFPELINTAEGKAVF